MAHKNSCWTLQVEILTPVHIGTGRELFFERDYILDGNNRLLVVDQNALFEELAMGEEDLSKLISNEEVLLSELVKRISGKEKGYELKILGNRSNLKQITGKDQDRKEEGKIREQIKDGFSRPYLPGSSIKGAIRTALLAKIVNENGLEAIKHYLPKPCDSRLPSKRSADNKLMRALFSGGAQEESKHDFLQALHVSDVTFAEDGLAVADIHYLNLVEQSAKPTWKIQGGKIVGKLVDWRAKEATLTFNEVLRPKSTSTSDFTLQIDHFLLKDQYQQLGWQNIPDFSDFNKLRELLNEHAHKRLEKEIKFFREHKLEQAKERCEWLRNKVINDDKGCYLQLGWGSGWRGMTGDWMDNQIEGDMRKCFGLGKVSKKACTNEQGESIEDRNGKAIEFYELNYPIFPKTRRLAVMNNQPCLPLGWVRIFFQETDSVLQLSKEEVNSLEKIQLLPEETALNNLQKIFENAKNSGEKQGGTLSNLLDNLLREANSWEASYQEKLAIMAETIYTVLKWWGNSEKKKQKQERLAQLKGLK